mmetsp:Transcript_13692/g.31592  ORF Transcript_13692/g.31592 Transcript_13692/m.31592 type:complete len:84 (+) Transcript_13692:218-469(+)
MNNHWNVKQTIETDERCWRFVSKMDAVTIADECGLFVLLKLFCRCCNDDDEDDESETVPNCWNRLFPFAAAGPIADAPAVATD